MNREEKDFWYALLDTLKNATASFILKHYPQLFKLMSEHGLNSLNFEHGIAVEEDYVLIANVNVESYFKLTTQVILVRPLPGGSRRIEVGNVLQKLKASSKHSQSKT